MGRLILFNTKIHECFQKKQLLSFSDTTDSFCIFLKIIGLYYSHREFNQTSTSSPLADPNITSMNEYNNKIDQLVGHTLEMAINNIANQYKGDENAYVQRREVLGQFILDYLRLKNNEIRGGYGLTLTNALGLLPTVLEQCFEAATLWSTDQTVGVFVTSECTK